MTDLAKNQREAVRLLGVYTRDTFDIWQLAGKSNAAQRQQIMTLLNNGKKTTKAESGVTAMTAAFYELAKPEGKCAAHLEDSFIEWCRYVEDHAVEA